VQFECILIGAGPELEHVEQQVGDLGLEDTVMLKGALPNDKLQSYLNSAVVFPLPAVVDSKGDVDGIPVALMEAMACSVPVISTGVSGIPELLRDGQAGYIVSEKNVEALADALELLLGDAALAKRFGEAGRAAVCQGFDIRKTSRVLRGLFAEAIARRKDGHE
jgi:glycosyltransferase involved in cell wall biosynthesis